MKFEINVPYQKLRKVEYPPIEEQLDALWKALSNLKITDPDALAMIETIKSVKKKIPKS